MKKLAIITALLTPLLAFADDAPKELTTLRDAWIRDRLQASASVDRRYVDALNALKLRFTRAGQLEGALAVDKEIKAAATATTASAKSAQADKGLANILQGSKWTHSGNVLTFASDSEFQMDGGPHKRYIVSGERSFQLQWNNSAAAKMGCELSKDGESFIENGKTVWMRKP